jgi:hypothetical protein
MELVPESLVPELAPPPIPPPNPPSHKAEGHAPDLGPPELEQSMRSIHAMQAGLFPLFILYIIMSIVIAVITFNGSLVGISLCGMIVPIIGKSVEKRNPGSMHRQRLIAIAALCIEAGLFFGWQSVVFFLFHGGWPP